MCRWTIRVLCWLALGAVVNVGVVLVSMWWRLQFMRTRSLHGNAAITRLQEWPLGTYAGETWPQPEAEFEYTIWGWTRRIDISRSTVYQMYIDSFGWPMRCVQRVLTVDDEHGVQVCWEGVLLDKSPWWRIDQGDVCDYLPTVPLYRGLAADVLFFAGLIGSVWLGPGQLRRSCRRRKGLCIHCSYPVGDPAKPCSECGRLPTPR